MIKLEKRNDPQILINNKVTWSTKYLSYYNYSSGTYTLKSKIPKEIRNRYNEPTIKEELKKETNDKCAYCESKMPHSSHGDIEHILPKSKRPDLTYNWENLTFACEVCNRTFKRNYYNPTEPLLNPYFDEPEQYLYASGAFVCDYHDKGHFTRLKLDLNRIALLERRQERLDFIQNLIRSWNCATGLTKEMYRLQLLEEIRPDREYSFIVKGLLKNANVI